MTELTAPARRTAGPAEAIHDGFIVPFYLSDRKLQHSAGWVAHKREPHRTAPAARTRAGSERLYRRHLRPPEDS